MVVELLEVQDESAVPLPPPWNIIFDLLFTPPGLYVVLVLILLCALGAAWAFFKEEVKPYLYAVLDVLAVVFRGVKAAVLGIWWAIKNMAYPMKEGCLNVWDTVDVCCNPYKKRRTRVDVPTFQF
mmetsp:Transcript_13141/g.30717  ORF Transcript_13141/g.30717 Transcript_13141/m.30717 type:complete len:125 (-) Transcript_13141:102-476(-)